MLLGMARRLRQGMTTGEFVALTRWHDAGIALGSLYMRGRLRRRAARREAYRADVMAEAQRQRERFAARGRP